MDTAVNVAASYRHRPGEHCESACQRNLLLSLGLDVEESVIFGLDGGFGLSFFVSPGSEPDIVVGKQAIFPLQAARLMGVKVEVHRVAGSALVRSLLDKHQVVIGRVDIGQLPYWGLEGRVAFGGYFVNIQGYDPVSQSFVLSDPAFEQPQRVRAEDLDRARASRKSPPINPDNQCFVFEAPKRAPQLEKVGPVRCATCAARCSSPVCARSGCPASRSWLRWRSAGPRPSGVS
jgi:butirosin biosynthesis protein H-like